MNKAIVGVGASGRGRASSPVAPVSFADWQIKFAQRMGQMKEPGVYPIAFIVDGNGRRRIVIQQGKIEELGGNNDDGQS